MNDNLRILVAAEGSAGIRIIKVLLSLGYKIVCVLAIPGHEAITSVWQFAINSGVLVWPAKKAEAPSFAKIITQHNINLIISVRFPYIIHKRILEIPQLGSFNLHTGLLPAYSGLNVVSWAIYNGEEKHGVTLHSMNAGIDTGPIVSQSMFDIDVKDTGLTLTRKCIEHGIPLIVQLVESASLGKKIHCTQQNCSTRVYYGKDIPQGGFIDWSLPAQQVINFIRACDFHPLPSPWGIPRAILVKNDTEIFICKANLTSIPCDKKPGEIKIHNKKHFMVATGDNWVEIKMIKKSDNYYNPREILKDGECFL